MCPKCGHPYIVLQCRNLSFPYLFQLMDAVPKSEWKPVTVAVAPSTVTINFEDPNEATLDCRVR